MRKTFLICLFFTLILQTYKSFYRRQQCGCGVNEVVRSKNLLCNGDFEQPVQRARARAFPNIPCWTTNNGNKFQIGYYNGQFPGSQFLELDASKGGQFYQQKVNLNEAGSFLLEFEMNTRPGVNLKDQAFYVTFNSLRLAYIAPSIFERRKFTFEVTGEKGANVLEFVDDGTGNGLSNGIDNVGLYKIRRV